MVQNAGPRIPEQSGWHPLGRFSPQEPEEDQLAGLNPEASNPQDGMAAPRLRMLVKQVLHNVVDERSLVHGFQWWRMISFLINASFILFVTESFYNSKSPIWQGIGPKVCRVC